jgi:hypothetical protein
MVDYVDKANPRSWRWSLSPPESAPPEEAATDHVWAVRDRNEVLRGLLRIGFGREKVFQKTLGFCLPCSVIGRGALALVKPLSNTANSGGQ